MFTGIVQLMGTVESLTASSGKRKLCLKAPENFWDDVSIGDSIAVNGTCLTVVKVESGCGFFDILDQTASTSLANQFCAGMKVNMEKALAVGQRLGGHFVSGHVDCRAKIIDRHKTGADWIFKIAFKPCDSKFIIDKGSVAVDGISLTVSAKTSDSFQINIIPHTIANTTLEHKKSGDEVNLEFDLVGKYVINYCSDTFASGKSSGMDMDFLKQNGFA